MANTMLLPCCLSEEEVAARTADLLAELAAQVQRDADRRAAARAYADADARCRTLATQVVTRSEHREVAVEIAADAEARTITVTRLDTAEVVSTRDMTDAEVDAVRSAPVAEVAVEP
jgi:hypothetical protein